MVNEHLILFNNYRVSQWLNKLKYDARLSDCVEQYLRIQIANWFHWHYWLAWDDSTDRCWHLSYAGIGENLIASDWYHPDAQQALDLWISSPGHNANMLYGIYNYVGIATIYDPITKTARRWQVFTAWPLKNSSLPADVQDHIDEENQNLEIPVINSWTTTDTLPDIYTTPNNSLNIFQNWKITKEKINNLIELIMNNQDLSQKQKNRIVNSLTNVLETIKDESDLNDWDNIVSDSGFLEIYHTINNNDLDNSIESVDELETVIKWMYNQWLTMYDNIDQFLPNNTMTREEASKFYWVFAQKIYNKKENSTKKCNFSDIKKADPTLRNNITNSCKLWIFQWYKNKFTPLQKLNNAEAITVLMRVIEGIKEEPKNKYYTNYFLKATEYGLINNINANNPITRWEAAMLIYKAYQHKNNISNTWNFTENIKPTIACALSEHDAWWYCVSNTQTCHIYKWIGTQVWNGSSRWNCSIYSCNSWYIEQNGSCVAHTTSCNTNQHLENNSCINNIRSCIISNGIGIQTWNNTRGSCTVLSCNNDYHIQGNICIKNIVIPTCMSSQHLENNICVSNTTDCTIANWNGQKMWNGSSRWTCTVTSCASGYINSGDISCILETS